jgi:anhydro-N-acetylmuramic acid kinase
VSKPLKAIGLMSGTSLDGIDVAMLVTDGEQVVSRGPSMTVTYDDEHRQLLRRAITDAESLDDRAARPGILLRAERDSTDRHIEAVKAYAAKFDIDLNTVDVIGYHGQTVVHRPDKQLTVQLGQGDVLAEALGTPVVYDMRANDMLHGGQGAPLVPAYHSALVANLPHKPVALVNIGGVANVTWIGEQGQLLAFDTGPGNALIDDWMKTHTGVARDESGSLGLVGCVDEATVAQFLGDTYFEMQAPKSLDRNSFSGVDVRGLSLADGAATLVAVTARSIALSQKLMPETPRQWIICGGGRHNRAIMQALESLLGNVQKAEDIGLNGDAVEAEAWAFLAVRSLLGLPLTYPGTTGVREPVTGGVLVKPQSNQIASATGHQ